MNWNPEVLQERLAGKMFGDQLHYYPETGSTNDEAFSLGLAGAAEGTVVIAESQSRGKGRFQRSWHSPPGANIYTSVILRPAFESAGASRIPLMAGVAVAEALNKITPDRAELKWPNDILLNGKKACGILAQARISEGKIDFIVLGIGINVNLGRRQLTEEIRDTATSLAIETGREISRPELIISLYEKLEKWYKKLQQKGFAPVRKRWLELAPMIGRQIQIKFGNEIVQGEARGIDDDGSLILFAGGKGEIKVSAGDATILKR